jgi:hypothetical protein
MFEAHFYSPESFNDQPYEAPSPLDEFTFAQVIEHPLYRCPVYVWGSTGKREGRVILFGYLEYRTLLGGRSEYHELLIEKASPNACIRALLEHDLPGIDPETTRIWVKDKL